MEKLCPQCSEVKPFSEYGKHASRRDGLQAYCLACSRKAVNASYLKLRQQALAHLGDRCRSCGFDADPRGLVIDHVRGGGGAKRKGGQANPRALLHAAMVDEEGDYQLLCANCNSIKRVAEEERGARKYVRVRPDGTRAKRCPRCETVKSVGEFGRNAGRHDGITPYCAPCMVAAGTESNLRFRAQAVAHLGGCCVQCGYAADIRALAIDHVAGDGGVERKAGTVNRAVLRAVLADTEGRYQLLCANCNTVKRIALDERGSRVYARDLTPAVAPPPDRRSSEDRRIALSESTKRLWQTPEHRAAMSLDRSERMRKRWASGEVPNRRRAQIATPEGG